MRRAVAHVKSNSGLLHDGTWVDGRYQAEELWRDKASVVPSDRAQRFLVFALLGTLTFLFLLPAYGLGALYLLIVNRFREVTAKPEADSQPKIAIGSALVIGGALSVVIVSASWCLIGTGSASNNRLHPVELMIDKLTVGGPSVSSFDLRSLKAGYHLRVTDDTHPTWLPNISRKDFIPNVPRGTYLPPSATVKQLPPGTEVVALPYWVSLVLDKEDARTKRFTPLQEQTGHAIWPPVYFSKGLQ